jgi:propionyl-CoA carboxylase alpha chain
VEKGSLLAPMPGGDPARRRPRRHRLRRPALIWLEAMKMEHTIAAPSDGVLTQLDVHVGQQVEVGTVLAGRRPALVPEGES